MLDGDHRTEDGGGSPTLARLGRALAEREARRHPPAAGAETWAGWGGAATADPALAGPAARRERPALGSVPHGSPPRLRPAHPPPLRKAGFPGPPTPRQRGGLPRLSARLGPRV